MRKVLISLAAAAATLAVAAPASAQAYGNLAPGYGYGYGAQAYGRGYGYGYGYGNFQGQIQQVRNQAYNLMRQGRLTRAESRDLNRDIQRVERRLYNSGRGGLSPYEAREMQNRIASLQIELRRYSDYDRRYRRGW